MGFFGPQTFEIIIREPGHLSYRESNRSFDFPIYEEDGEIVIVPVPSRCSVDYVLLHWFSLPAGFSDADLNRIHPRLLQYFHEQGRKVRLFERGESEGNSFVFYPELFEQRSKASDLLDGAGINAFSEYSSIDLLHAEYGLEVCGIHEQSNVEPVAEVMQKAFPHWHFNRICYKDYGREPGWKFSIHMFRRHCGGERPIDAR
jgi:hypothetical protein